MPTHVVNAGARLDRLPIARFHWRILGLIGAGAALDAFDIYLAAGVTRRDAARRFRHAAAERGVHFGDLLRHAPGRRHRRLDRRPVRTARLLPVQPGAVRGRLAGRLLRAEHPDSDRAPLHHGHRPWRRAGRGRRHAVRVHPAGLSRALDLDAGHRDQCRPADRHQRRLRRHPVARLALHVRHRRRGRARGLGDAQADAGIAALARSRRPGRRGQRDAGRHRSGDRGRAAAAAGGRASVRSAWRRRRSRPCSAPA